MSTTYGTRRLRRAAAPTGQVGALFKGFWSAFQEWRARRIVRATLLGLSDRELADIGTTRGEIDYVASQRSIVRQYRTTDRYDAGTLLLLLLCTALNFVPVYGAKAQCTAQDVLRNRLLLSTAAAAPDPQDPISSAADVPIWKTIAIGTFRDPVALRDAMSAMGCGVGNSAAEVLARPAFTVSGNKADLDLVIVSAAQLGIQSETVPLRKMYAHAQRRGLGLAPAEVAPQLRLQYLDQPIGEFLIIAMEPIRTWSDDPVILTVANGGAGLILIGQDGHDDSEVPAMSRFVFVRPHDNAPAEAALLHD
ncbi:hypothetical protein CWO91_28455 [Bradyrhizobium genosp. SA-3]|uniref:DUF1127 domain-containing protein n=1 Tax=Bradyrhizobium genosp. SA-3 TaxID=508868 RepID=UPI00102A257A|nr:DUF1127 domain-containing protein [Bradyrhizobium genosp. SA-3]RZN07180.1 hypothetical protein CWO91_28455 [Bradyrhizobium genosp. SA-3]